MCGRYLLYTDSTTLARDFAVDVEPPRLVPRYNIAPGQTVPLVVVRGGRRTFSFARWGFIPAWARPSTPVRPLINARSETAAVKPAFREAIRNGRCLVPADGFYEWQRDGRARRAFYIGGADERPLAFAGILSPWQTPDGELIDTLAVLTSEPNAEMRAVHDRMPCILDGAARTAWLEGADPRRLLGTAPDGRLVLRAVGPAVNDTRHDSPACLEPAPPTPPMLF